MNSKLASIAKKLALVLGKDTVVWASEKVEQTIEIISSNTREIKLLKERVAELEKKAHGPCSCRCAGEK